jgi:RNA polymerase sigma factor (sigma-70 family)
MKVGEFNGIRRYLQSMAASEIGETLSDAELLSRFVRQPDATDFGILLRRHGPMIYAVCRRTLRDAHDVEDAFQATILVFVRKAPSIRRQEVLGSWLYAVAHRVAVRLRNTVSRRVLIERLDPETIATAAARTQTDSVMNPVLDAELSRLPAKYRLPVVLCYLQGRTNVEAAEQLGWPVGTVKGRLARARRMLRRQLQARGMTFAATGVFLGLDEAAAWAQVPKSLVRATTSSVLRFLAGDDAEVSSRAILLANGVIRTMVAFKLAAYSFILLAAASLMIGGGMLHQSLANEAPVGDAPPPQKKANQIADTPVKKETFPITVSGTAKDEAGKPVAGAHITLFSNDQGDAVLGTASTDANGNYKVQGQLPLGLNVQGPSFSHFAISGVAAGKGLSTRTATFITGKRSLRADPSLASYFAGEPIEFNLRFVPGTEVKGQVIDEDGKPVANAKVRVLLPKYITGGAIQLTYSPESILATRTNEDGRFHLANLLAGKPFELHVKCAGFAPFSFDTWQKEDMRAAATSELKCTLKRPRHVEIRVVCADTEKPVANVAISEGNDASDPILGKTDASGQLNLDLAPGGYAFRTILPQDSAYLPLEHTMRVDSGGSYRLTMVLKPGCILNLEAIDSQSGKGIKGIAFLRLVDNQDWTPMADLEQADADGPFPWLDGSGTMRPMRLPVVQDGNSPTNHPTTGPSGSLRAVVNPGTGCYRIVPVDGYEPEKWMIDEVDLPAGKSVTVQFKLRKK